MPELILKQSQIYSEPVYNSNSEVVGEITFKPSDAMSLSGYSKLVAIYIDAMEKSKIIGINEAESKKVANSEIAVENAESIGDALTKMSDALEVQAKAFVTMQPVIDDTFGVGSEKILFNGGCDMPLMFALIDWASQYADTESNKDWQEYKARVERVNAAKLNREQRRSRGKS